MASKEKEWFIQAPWGRICIVAWGDCFNPPVLMCHGSMDSAYTFKRLVEHLPDKFYYIGIELPGNGRSDPFPPGLMIHIFDMLYAVRVVVTHFRWQHFIYMSHSLGTSIGKYYDMCYPNEITKLVELDPTGAYGRTYPTFKEWYARIYGNFFEKYEDFNLSWERTSSYSREQAIEKLANNRHLPKECAELLLTRITETLDDGSVRFKLDRRIRLLLSPPNMIEANIKSYQTSKTPTLAVIAEGSLQRDLYNPLMKFEESFFPNRNVRFRRVRGGHDVHVTHPERFAAHVERFLLHGLPGLDDSKAKL